ncbi:MAG: hypothetical protein [Circular genetic element sp.]|nr:MAG: hypothetical protein [Circular genetic element sp.]
MSKVQPPLHSVRTRKGIPQPTQHSLTFTRNDNERVCRKQQQPTGREPLLRKGNDTLGYPAMTYSPRQKQKGQIPNKTQKDLLEYLILFIAKLAHSRRDCTRAYWPTSLGPHRCGPTREKVQQTFLEGN